MLLTIDAAKLEPPVRFELADGEHFPHLYGPLDPNAVIDVTTLEPDDTGALAITSR